MGYIDSLLGRNERIVFLTRRHWIHLLPIGLVRLLVIGAMMAAGAVFVGPTGGVSMAAAIILALVPMGDFLRRFAWWWNEKYMVTNRRVVQVEGILDKHVIDSSLEKVNDVVLRQSAMGRLLGFGDIEILTASEIGVNRLTRIHRPIRFKTEMLNQKESLGEIDAFQTRARRLLASEPPTAGDIPELIAELDELRQKGILSQAEFDKKKQDLLSRM